MIRHALTLTLVLVLSGCGFHLRNALVLPADMGPVRVVAQDKYSPLAQSLAQALARAGATAADASASDVATLRVVSERWGNTPLSVDAQGRAQEFTLSYGVVFELLGASGEALVPRQTVELSRDYVSPPADSTGTDSEREILGNELRREMSAAVLRRIDAAARGTTGG